MSFVSTHTVRFSHVDAAGIVFYPRYFELLNAVVEDYFAQEIGVSFAQMHLERKLGIPTVDLAVNFSAPSRLGDSLDFELSVERVGRSSMNINVIARCGNSKRMEAKATLVCMDLTSGKSTPWPDDMQPRVHAPEVAVGVA